MPEPLTNPNPRSSVPRLAPWAVFAVLLLGAVAAFFVYADRVPSLLQVLADH